jgi:hypothetical protein
MVCHTHDIQNKVISYDKNSMTLTYIGSNWNYDNLSWWNVECNKIFTH